METAADPRHGTLIEPGAAIPSLRVRARRSVARMLPRRGVFASGVALAALIVSHHYGGFLGTGKYQTLR
jgi:hypothetical protein